MVVMTLPAPPPKVDDRDAAIALLRWYVEMGADEAIAAEPANRFAPPPAPAVVATASSPSPSPPQPQASPAVAAAPPKALTESLAEAAQSARRLAATAESVAGLAALVAGFDGCGLKRTATNTVFADGNPAAPGQLLDKMLAAIGLDRQGVLITNVVYWRPPGNRTPTTAEIASCLPFVLRHIALVRPKILVLAGGTATGALLPWGQGITRLRGRWFDLEIPGLAEPVPTLPMFHPSFLLRTPERKREAWRDLLALRARLDELLGQK